MLLVTCNPRFYLTQQHCKGHNERGKRSLWLPLSLGKGLEGAGEGGEHKRQGGRSWQTVPSVALCPSLLPRAAQHQPHMLREAEEEGDLWDEGELLDEPV